MEEAIEKSCRELIARLKRGNYFRAVLPALEKKVRDLEKEGEPCAWKKVLSHLHDVLREAESGAEGVIRQRIADGKIHDASQARKSVAGNLFQQMVAYVLAKNVLEGFIRVPVTVVQNGEEKNRLLNRYAAIHVGDEVQKPDCDVLVYCPSKGESPILNFSCKTSCRERAGQTYKWKILSDLAASPCIYREGNPACPATKYQLSYERERPVLTCFITADLYGEIAQPQIRGMFGFFDKSYLAKPSSDNPLVSTLDTVVDDINAFFEE